MLGAFFSALSADEAASLHELLVVPLRRLVGESPSLRYPLILPGVIVLPSRRSSSAASWLRCQVRRDGRS